MVVVGVSRGITPSWSWNFISCILNFVDERYFGVFTGAWVEENGNLVEAYNAYIVGVSLAATVTRPRGFICAWKVGFFRSSV